MMVYYLLYGLFVIVWIIGVYLFFNRKKIAPENNNKPQSKIDIIAVPNEPKIRVIFDQSDPANLDMKSLADFTVKYSDLLSGNYALPKEQRIENDILTGKGESEKADNMDLTDYINIFTIKKLKSDEAIYCFH